MRVTRALVAVLLGLALLPSVTATPAIDEDEFAKLKAQAGVDGGTDEGLAYLKSITPALETAIKDAFWRCSTALANDKTPAFEFIAQIGKEGAVQAVVIQPDDAFTACYSRAFGTTKLAAPPSDPFHVYVGMKAED